MKKNISAININMSTIEIRYNNKTLIPMLILLTLGLIGGSAYIFFSGKFKLTTTLILWYAAMSIALIYTIYLPAKRLIRKDIIFTLTNNAIVINDRSGPVVLAWSQILDWKIETDENTHYLVLTTEATTKKINISWLDRKPAEIEDLIKGFQQQ